MSARKSAIVLCIATMCLIPVIPISADDISTLSFSFDYPNIMETPNGNIIEVAHCQNYESNGRVVPVYPTNILIPFGKRVANIEAEGSIHHLGKYQPIKAQPLVVGNHTIESMPRDTTHRLYQIVGTYSLRGYNLLVMNLFPVWYDHGELYYYSKIDITIHFENGDINPLYRGRIQDRKVVEKVADNKIMLNTYPCSDQENSVYEYLIITNNELSAAFEEYAAYKEEHGMRTKIMTVENITTNSSFFGEAPLFNDTQAQIRNCIRYAYNTWGINYVLLGGDGDVANSDHNIIPPRYLFATAVGLPLRQDEEYLEANIPSDVYYACLDGTFNQDRDDKWGENATGNTAGYEDEADLYAEVWVGRVSADCTEEVQHFIKKTIAYGENTNRSHMRQFLLLGEWVGFGGEAEWGGNHKDLVRPLIPSTYNVTTLYDRDREQDWDDEDLLALLNDEAHIINHDGHCFTTYALRLRPNDIRDLNNNQFFFIYSTGCYPGAFDNAYGENRFISTDCMAELLTLGEDGAFAVVMNARYGLGRYNTTDSPGTRFDYSFFKAVFEDNIWELGPANHHAKEEQVWRIDENGMRWTYFQTNLFGDPQIRLREDYTATVNLTRPENGLYLFEKGPFISQFPFTIILGPITVEAEPETVPPGRDLTVAFYLNGEKQLEKNNPPFTWTCNKQLVGLCEISVEVHTTAGYVDRDIKQVFIIQF